MARAYSYVRFSTPEQASGDSLRRQLADAQAWCAERDIVLDDGLRDLGISAFRGAHRSSGALGRFLQLVKNGEVQAGSYLLVESLDRLSREAAYDALRFLIELIEAGIKVVSLDDGQEYSPEIVRREWTRLILPLAQLARSHEESRLKSVRVGKAWSQKREAARKEGRLMTRRCPAWLDIVDDRFETNSKKAVVERIFDETIAGYGRRDIARRLNADEIPVFRSKENWKNPPQGWQPSSIAKILESRSVLGEYQPHSGTHSSKNRKPCGPPISDYYPRIIEDEKFWRARSAILGRRQRGAGRKGDEGAHILQGLAKCGACGGSMHIVNKGKPPKGSVYLNCSSNARNGGCKNSRKWRVDLLEHAVLEGLNFIEGKLFSHLDEKASSTRTALVSVQAELQHAKDVRRRLLDVVKSTDDAEAKHDFEYAAAAVLMLEAKLKELQTTADRQAADPGTVSRLVDVALLSSKLADTKAEERRDLKIRIKALLNEVLTRIECHEKIGAVMVLGGRSEHFDVNGSVPYGFFASFNGIWMSLDRDVSYDLFSAHYGAPTFGAFEGRDEASV